MQLLSRFLDLVTRSGHISGLTLQITLNQEMYRTPLFQREQSRFVREIWHKVFKPFSVEQAHLPNEQGTPFKSLKRVSNVYS